MVASLGEGPEALVAAEGEELVVASYETSRADDAPPGSGTATLVVDGRRTALPAWSSVTDSSWLVVSVPTGAREVVLEVLSDGRAQAVSLLTGERGPGAAQVLYRAERTLGVGAALEVDIPLPQGDSAGAEAVVTEVGLEAWLPGPGWAPTGSAYLVVGLDAVDTREPCCDLGPVDVTSVWTLVLPGGTVVPDTGEDGADSPLFVLDESVTTARLQLSAVATFDVGSATAPVPTAIDLGLPS